jgi:chromate transporter
VPGPEAHELRVYFGMLARAHVGGVLAVLDFMLPGFVARVLLAWVYVTYGIASPLFASAFHSMQAFVRVVVVRAVGRIGAHTLRGRWL